MPMTNGEREFVWVWEKKRVFQTDRYSLVEGGQVWVWNNVVVDAIII